MEILQDKLVVKKPNSDKAKLELELALIAPFSDRTREETVSDVIAITFDTTNFE